MLDRPRAVFLTGDVGAGKTTALERVVRTLGLVVSGFRTPAVREDGRVRGVRLVSLGDGGREHPWVASIESGRLLPHPDVFETQGVQILQKSLKDRSARCLVMDELGFLETEAARFRAMVHRCIDDGPLVLGVLKRGDAPLPRSVAARPDVTVVEIEKTRRDEGTSSLLVLVSSLLDVDYRA